VESLTYLGDRNE